jgi:hypothetical protein
MDLFFMDISGIIRNISDLPRSKKQGNLVKLQVLKSLGSGKYRIMLAGKQFPVDSTVKLPTGKSVLAQVFIEQGKTILKLISEASLANTNKQNPKASFLALLQQARVDVSDSILELINHLEIESSLFATLLQSKRKSQRQLKSIINLLSQIKPESRLSFFQFSLHILGSDSNLTNEQLQYLWNQFWEGEYHRSKKESQQETRAILDLISEKTGWIFIPLESDDPTMVGFFSISL